MGILALSADERVRDVHISADTITVALMDGRSISVPLAWFPQLLDATPAQRARWEPAGGATASIGRPRRGPQHRRPAPRCACGKEAAGRRVKAARPTRLTPRFQSDAFAAAALRQIEQQQQRRVDLAQRLLVHPPDRLTYLRPRHRRDLLDYDLRQPLQPSRRRGRDLPAMVQCAQGVPACRAHVRSWRADWHPDRGSTRRKPVTSMIRLSIRVMTKSLTRKELGDFVE